MSGKGSFHDLLEYVEFEKDGTRRDDCLEVWSRNVSSTATAASEMDATAALAKRPIADPVLHVITSFRPGETPTLDDIQASEEIMLRSLGADGHESFSALHYDADRDVYHVHTAINRINPTTHTALDLWASDAKLARAAEYSERAFGFSVDRRWDWRAKVGERDLSLEHGPEPEAKRSMRGSRERTMARTAPSGQARDARARAHYDWSAIMRQEVAPIVAQTMAEHDPSWRTMHAALAPYGVSIERAGSGYRIVGPEHGQHIRASELGIDARALDATLGEYRPPAGRVDFQTRLAIAKDAAPAWTSWDEAHAQLADAGLAIARKGNGAGQVRDLAGDRRAPVAKTFGSTIAEMEQRLGQFVEAPAIEKLHERDAERRAEGLAAKVEALRADPAAVLAPIAEMQSTWTRDDVSRAVRARLGLSHDTNETNTELVAEATRSVLTQCVALDDGADVVDGVPVDRTVYSTREIIDEERAMFAAAETLCDRDDAPKIRPAPEALDEQQKRAYEHLASEKDFALANGIAGAGKSRLQRDLAEGYESAGYRVLGAAVAGDAADVLGREANINSRNVAQLISDLELGRETLTSRDVLLIDEAGTLGTRQAQYLFEAARDAGAKVRMLGDSAQHESVGRGATFRALLEEYGGVDMETSRRAEHQWLRDVAKDLRAGRVAPAYDALRAHGAIKSFETDAEAKEYLAAGYVDAIVSKRTALLIADENIDVRELNGLAQKGFADRGLLGAAKPYDTAFGPTQIHVNDTIAIREKKKIYGHEPWRNGDRARVLEHLEDGRMRVARERDGVIDVWDTAEHSRISLGYAKTSYRSQGGTVNRTFQLPSKNLRGGYVGATRATESTTIAHGRDRVRDFGALMYQTSRASSKRLVRDVETQRAQRIEREQIREREIDREHTHERVRSL